MAEIIEVPVYKFDSELEKIIRQSNTFEKRFKQYDFQNLDWNDGEVTAAESGIIVGGIAIVFLLIFLTIRGSVKNQKSRREREAYASKIKSKEYIAEQEERRKKELAFIKENLEKCKNNPDLNIDIYNDEAWQIHWDRLNTFGRSMHSGEMYYKGSRGGIYTVSANGTRNYKY